MMGSTESQFCASGETVAFAGRRRAACVELPQPRVDLPVWSLEGRHAVPVVSKGRDRAINHATRAVDPAQRAMLRQAAEGVERELLAELTALRCVEVVLLDDAHARDCDRLAAPTHGRVFDRRLALADESDRLEVEHVVPLAQLLLEPLTQEVA